MARLGRIIGAVAGGLLGGPAGAIAGYMAGHSADEAKRGKKEANKIAADQNRAYDQQQSTIRRESERLNAQLESARSKAQAGVARASRSRIRGGIFGDSGGGQLNPRLG